MPLVDASAQVIAGVVGTIVTTFGLVIIAIINNRRERKGSAEASMEATLRERILLKEEKIADLKDDKLELLEENSKLHDQKADLLEKIRELESERRRDSA